MARRLMVWSVVAVSLVWIGVTAWIEFNNVDPELAEFRQQQFETKLNDCRGKFSDRYDCKSAVIRDQNQQTLTLWATRLGIIFGPPIVLAILFAIVGHRMEKRRLAELARTRAKRKAAADKAARERAADEGRQRMAELQKKKDTPPSPPAADNESG